MRFRNVPKFSEDTIRRIKENVSEMKRLAARDYEDILQVNWHGYQYILYLILEKQISIPVFENLFPDAEDDRFIQSLLFSLSDWHTLAKLRLHTTGTIKLLEFATTELGRYFRAFASKVSAKYTTYETPTEHAKRLRMIAQKASIHGHSTQPQSLPSTSTRKLRGFHLRRVKFHFLGDYTSDIRAFGTTDSFTSRLVGNISLNEKYLLT